MKDLKLYTFKVTLLKTDEVLIEKVEAYSLQEAEDEINSLYMYFAKDDYCFRRTKIETLVRQNKL